MTTPSNAAKAAAVLCFTWGVPDALSALQIYERLDSGETFESVFHDDANCGVWAQVENLGPEGVWDNVVSLAESIDTCREELEGPAST